MSGIVRFFYKQIVRHKVISEIAVNFILGYQIKKTEFRSRFLFFDKYP